MNGTALNYMQIPTPFTLRRGHCNQTIHIVSLATPPLNFLQLVTNSSYPCAPLRMRTALQHAYTYTYIQ